MLFGIPVIYEPSSPACGSRTKCCADFGHTFSKGRYFQLFVDIATIHIEAGDGGNGVVAFHREKYVPAGGPDGGDGGNGGDVIFAVDPHMSTLMDFRFKRKFKAQNGAPGAGAKKSGKRGESIVIKLPPGTLIKEASSGRVVHDMGNSGEFVCIKGGRGGWGNQHFATPTRQAPRFARDGLKGGKMDVTLELKLIADVGLAGFPNVGKSTILSVVSAARPKIADYHFTTLAPNLGVVAPDNHTSYVMADIPGIIEGAADGAGLGLAFLRHIERCRLVVHVVDVSGSEGRDPVEDFEIISRELETYSPALASRPVMVAANKCDLVADSDRGIIDRFRAEMGKRGLEVHEISAATGQGMRELVYAIAARLNELPPIEMFEPEYGIEETDGQGERDITITVDEEGVYRLGGEWIERMAGPINPSDFESLSYLGRVLKNAGVFEMLEEAGIKENDTVAILGFEFDYVK